MDALICWSKFVRFLGKIPICDMLFEAPIWNFVDSHGTKTKGDQDASWQRDSDMYETKGSI